MKISFFGIVSVCNRSSNNSQCKSNPDNSQIRVIFSTSCLLGIFKIEFIIFLIWFLLLSLSLSFSWFIIPTSRSEGFLYLFELLLFNFLALFKALKKIYILLKRFQLIRKFLIFLLLFIKHLLFLCFGNIFGIELLLHASLSLKVSLFQHFA